MPIYLCVACKPLHHVLIGKEIYKPKIDALVDPIFLCLAIQDSDSTANRLENYEPIAFSNKYYTYVKLSCTKLEFE